MPLRRGPMTFGVRFPGGYISFAANVALTMTGDPIEVAGRSAGSAQYVMSGLSRFSLVFTWGQLHRALTPEMVEATLDEYVMSFAPSGTHVEYSRIDFDLFGDYRMLGGERRYTGIIIRASEAEEMLSEEKLLKSGPELIKDDDAGEWDW